jgi:ribonuclease HII
MAAKRALENAIRRVGFVHVAGADEVGRGCLAGPVVAAAVVLDPAKPIRGLADSKLLSAARREHLSAQVQRDAVTWAIGEVGPAEIDRVNIAHASLEAMRRAVMALVPLPGFVLVDAFRIPGLPMPQRGVVHGDRLCAVIAAASIVAKVHRDRGMVALHREDPRYGFDRHKGYGTAEHLAALARHGYSAAHRRSFRPASLFDTIGEAPERDPDGVTSRGI